MSTRNLAAMYHPVVIFAYLAAVILFAMFAFQPVYVTLSFAGALCASLVFQGWRATLRALLWIAVLWCAITLCNFVFSAAGSTALFVILGRSFYLEALAYGATMGGLFAAMVLWFHVYSVLIDSDAEAVLTGKIAPLVTLIVSQVMRLVPQFLKRARAIEAVHSCTSAARPRTKREAAFARFRTLSVLMAWGMEDSIQRGDAMRSRGWGCGVARTRYSRQRFMTRDALALVFVALLVVGNAFLAAVACGQFSFYPYMDTLVLWWGYVPYALLVFLPSALVLWERLLWR